MHTQEQLQAVIDFAAPYDIILDEVDAELFLTNRETLAVNPHDIESQRIAGHFAAILGACKENLSIDDFVRIPLCPRDCKYCLDRDERYRDRTLERMKHLRQHHV